MWFIILSFAAFGTTESFEWHAAELDWQREARGALSLVRLGHEADALGLVPRLVGCLVRLDQIAARDLWPNDDARAEDLERVITRPVRAAFRRMGPARRDQATRYLGVIAESLARAPSPRPNYGAHALVAGGAGAALLVALGYALPGTSWRDAAATIPLVLGAFGFATDRPARVVATADLAATTLARCADALGEDR